MRQVAVSSVLLVLGMMASQVLPYLLRDVCDRIRPGVHLLTMIGLAIIMIHVGYELEIQRD